MARVPPLKIVDDCFAALVRLFLQSPQFAGYSPATRDLWGRELGFASRPDTLGPISLTEIRPSLVQAYFDGLSGRPAKQAAALCALRQLDRWAVTRDYLPRPITFGIEIETSDGGHVPWTDEQVALAESHARPDLARAITLAAHTGQRGIDLVRLGPTDIETYDGRDGIHLRQIKTCREVWVPISTDLAAAIATWDRAPGPWLRMPDGRPWRRAALTKAWLYERDHNASLEPLRRPTGGDWAPRADQGLVLHGLRGTACVRLRRAGATESQISAMVGLSIEMVTRDCRLSSQRDNAMAAVVHLERNRREQNRDTSNKGRS